MKGIKMIKKIIVSFLSALYLFICGLYIYSVYGMMLMESSYLTESPDGSGYILTHGVKMSASWFIVMAIGLIMFIVLVAAITFWFLYLVKRKNSYAKIFCILNIALGICYLLVGSSAFALIATIYRPVCFFTSALQFFRWVGNVDIVTAIQDVIFLFLPIVYAFIPLGWELIKRKKTKTLQ